jgi:PHD/YefM family antitoxin component YafN of YafNO toxin-antitoxin module
MTSIATTKLRSTLSETISRVTYNGERIRLERNGKAVAAIVTADDLELLERLENKMDLKAVRAALKESGRTPWAEMKKSLGL